MIKLLIGTCALVTAMFVNAVGGRVEGYLFPVVTMAEIAQIEAVGETRSRIWGRATRLRQCSFHELVWYLGDEAKNARADLIFEEGTKARGQGVFDFGPWLVQLRPAQLTERSYAVVYHRCHIFWLTQTRFFG